MQTYTPSYQDSHDCLCVDLSNEMGYPLSIHINSIEHKQPLFWQSWSNDDLLVDSSFLQAPGLPIAMLLSPEQLNNIPQQTLAIAMAMPAKQYQLIQGMLTSSAAMELALSNPLLFMLLVNHAELQKLDVLTFKALVLQKRSEILRYLQLPSSASVVKMLARIDVKQHLFVNLNSVIEVLNNTDSLNNLQHAQHPCINHFLFLQRYRGLCWSGLLNMIFPQSTMVDIGYIQRLAQDSFLLGADLNNLRLISTVKDLKKTHDRLVSKQNQMSVELRAEQHQQHYGDFPTPPLPGNEIIVPLQSWYELAIEGLQMHHCVSAYHKRIYEGRVFIYRVLTNPRVTLSLQPKGYDWIISEARSYANTQASEKTMCLVHNWLNAANKNKRKRLDSYTQNGDR